MKRIVSHGLGVLALCSAAALGVAWLTGSPSAAQGQGLDAGLGRWSLSGNLTVELRIDPTVGAAAADWQGPITRVDEVSLFDEYAVLRRRDVGKNSVLIVPREKLLWITLSD